MTETTDRRSYHHGDLRNALVRAAADLAEEGGPEAITIRAAARIAGVTPTATYRHFANQVDLLCAARDDAMERMAAVIIDLVPPPAPDADPATVAVDRITAAGRGYVRFAVEQPGLFRTAFCPVRETDDEVAPLDERLAASPPYAFLSAALDGLVDAGLMDPAQRPGAEAGAWAAVHGLSLLLIDGPYRDADAAARDAVVDITLGMVVRGLTGGRADCARR
ncbi:TetR/AcrR family transcriptional regulator [Nocardioides antri]|uniref:TetR family transcriptional regulator n=1 Tax=Nocardioides antri TaxID=2607659 RepID=A0A5B1M7Y4_9ACTN|nr:TetR/AcrR family transcriptional regulator [Nocardioides antri]KAA1428834.1 TetR family transcriptional regulator [Nocardioides antri]